MQTLSKAAAKKYQDLKAALVVAEREIYVGAPLSREEVQKLRDDPVLKSNWMVKRREAMQKLNEVREAETKFKKKYLKAPVLPEHLKVAATLTVTTTRNGTVTLHSSSKTYKAGGGGYDRVGRVLGEWIKDTFDEVLQQFNPIQIESLYGVNAYASNNGKVTIDGACGENCMIDILKYLGFAVTRIIDQSESRNGVVGYSIEYSKKH